MRPLKNVSQGFSRWQLVFNGRQTNRPLTFNRLKPPEFAPPPPLQEQRPLSEQLQVLFPQLLEPCPTWPFTTPPPPFRATVGAVSVKSWDFGVAGDYKTTVNRRPAAVGSQPTTI